MWNLKYLIKHKNSSKSGKNSKKSKPPPALTSMAPPTCGKAIKRAIPTRKINVTYKEAMEQAYTIIFKTSESKKSDARKLLVLNIGRKAYPMFLSKRTGTYLPFCGIEPAGVYGVKENEYRIIKYGHKQGDKSEYKEQKAGSLCSCAISIITSGRESIWYRDNSNYFGSDEIGDLTLPFSKSDFSNIILADCIEEITGHPMPADSNVEIKRLALKDPQDELKIYLPDDMKKMIAFLAEHGCIIEQNDSGFRIPAEIFDDNKEAQAIIEECVTIQPNTLSLQQINTPSLPSTVKERLPVIAASVVTAAAIASFASSAKKRI